MVNSSTERYDAKQAYWNAVESDTQYKATKIIGRYVLAIIFLLGTVGNLLSFAVMVRRNMRRSSTAFYMAALALADTMVLLFGCLRRWVVEVFEVDLLNEGTEACLFVNFLQYWSFDVAVWILVIMTMDRVIVVAAPLKAHIYATRKRAMIGLFIVTVICSGVNIHFFFTTTYSGNVCRAKEEYLDFYQFIWSWVDATVYSFVPFILLLTMNVLIIVFLTQANAKSRQMKNHFKIKRSEEQGNAVNSRKLTIMLLSITCAFIILTAPAVTIHILREKGKPFFDLTKPQDMAKYILTRQVSRVLLYLNHSINFLLYCITGSKFRQELNSMIRCQTDHERRRQRALRNAMASETTQSMTNIAYSPNSSRAEEYSQSSE